MGSISTVVRVVRRQAHTMIYDDDIHDEEWFDTITVYQATALCFPTRKDTTG